MVCFFALLITGAEIVISHPRFYWGETGNVNMKPLFTIPIPSSRDTVPTGYSYVMPDQNGWSRYLHFEAAWAAGADGAGVWDCEPGERTLSQGSGAWSGASRSWRALSECLGQVFAAGAADEADARSYNVMQRVAYLGVIFVLFPLVIWTGLALSPSFNSAFPFWVNVLGGQADRADAALLCVGGAGGVSGGACGDGCDGGILEPDAGDDHGRGGAAEGARMKPITRSRLITGGVAATAGLAGLAAARRWPRRYGLVPPDAWGFYGPGETLTYGAQRLLTAHSLAREFPRSMISKTPFMNESAPPSDEFKRLQAGGFKDWRLAVDGMVARPGCIRSRICKRCRCGAKLPRWCAKRDGRISRSGLGRR